MNFTIDQNRAFQILSSNTLDVEILASEMAISHLLNNLSSVRKALGKEENYKSDLDFLQSDGEIWHDTVILVDHKGYGRYFISGINQDRVADVYPNAHTKGTTFGVNINEHSPGNSRWQGGKFLGNLFSEQDALTIAKDFVAYDKVT